MKAWQFVEAGKPLTLNEVPEPVAGAGEVVVEVKAAGICHSDTGYIDGTLTPVLAFHPITLGHEIAGTISAIGDGVTTFSTGDRVVIPAKVEGAGTSLNGGFASHVASPAEFVIPLPDGIDWDQAAAATDAGMTSYHAVVVQGGVTAGTKVGIIGLGGWGPLERRPPSRSGQGYTSLRKTRRCMTLPGRSGWREWQRTLPTSRIRGST
jgi:propanol-preferring alcohol dehydrogenase